MVFGHRTRHLCLVQTSEKGKKIRGNRTIFMILHLNFGTWTAAASAVKAPQTFTNYLFKSIKFTHIFVPHFIGIVRMNGKYVYNEH